ncbi:flap endonuclease-1 [archaeon GW2011_AR15]|nr:flap endonuclease-1 [archaeon GW2011_AR15]MBS3103912.1 flap endonuclease-1 [Candidatus Woesearchaeota archaeon]
MGTNLSTIIVSKEITLSDLSGKPLAVDAYNLLYQFITTIRQPDGTPLMDSKGNITSHLSGLFFRVTKLMNSNIKLAFVFDGKPPELKKEEIERRKEVKQDAQRKYEKAVEEEDIELMRKYSARTARLTQEMIDESKELVAALGLPVIQAPSEGEAQASYMAKKGDVYGIVSQDTDGMLFGSPIIIKNLSITGRRKIREAYHKVLPEQISLSDNLNELGLDQEQLIIVAMLCGTDFNVGGVKGIGPKKALALVKKHKKDFNKVFEEAKWSEFFEYPWKKVFSTIKNIPTTDEYSLKWGAVDREKIYEILVERHEFLKERIDSSISGVSKKQAQKGLSDFF